MIELGFAQKMSLVSFRHMAVGLTFTRFTKRIYVTST